MSLGVRIKNYFKNINCFSLFLIIECVLITGFLTLDYLQHGAPFNYGMRSFLTRFGDYYMHIGFASAPFGSNIYEFSSSACFPPFAYLMYAALARLCGYQSENPQNTFEPQQVGMNQIIFLIYNIFCILLLVYAINLYINKYKKSRFVALVLFPAVLIFSYPMAFSSLQRGNSVFLVAILLSIALAWKDDPSKLKRELAMILIAVCAGMKIYPAVFGILYLKEKRWKEAIRLVIYGAVIFFVPFAFFGGIAGMQSFFHTIFALYGEVHSCSVSGFVSSIVKGVFGNNTKLFATIIQQLYLIFAMVAFFCTKTKRGEILILSSLITVYVASGWDYTCVYMLPALLMFLREKDEQPIRIHYKRILDILAFVMFIVTFSRPYYADHMVIYITIIIGSILYHWITVALPVYHLYKSL